MITPNKTKSNWILYWLLVIPITYEVVKHMFDPTITLGDIIVLVITVPAFAILVWQGINYWFYRRHPFDMVYQKELPYKGEPNISDKKVISLGESQILLKLKPKKVTIIDRVHIRLINKPNPNSVYPSKDIIHIKTLGYLAESLVNSYISEEDYTNGRQTGFKDPYRCAPEDSFYIVVHLKATNVWNGYIMFQANRMDGHRGYAYLPLNVKEKV